MPFASVLLADDGEVVAAPTAPRYIRVYGYSISSRTAINEVELRSASTVKARTEACAQAGGVETVMAPYKSHLFDCAAGENLNANLSAAGNVAVNVLYSVEG